MALEKAVELEKERQELTRKTVEYSAKLGELNNQINNIVDDKKFYRSLVEEMDCFVVWHYIDDVE